MRRKFIAGNWKLNKNVAESLAFAKDFKARVAGVKNVDIAIATVFTALYTVAAELKGSNVWVSAQDVYHQASGAFTGEVSAPLLKEAGASWVIIGHSERRQYFGETNATVNQKLKAVLAAGLGPIVCVGETLAERESGKAFDVIGSQVKGGLAGLSPEEAKKVVIAYEPVWAIGTGKTASPAQAQEVHAFIRSELKALFGASAAETIRIQYGGSVKADNAKELMGQADIDGALVGGASLDPASFEKIVKYLG
jgi:triosephosphate isomerase